MHGEHSDIILRLGGYRRVAASLGRPLTTVHSWQRRNSIPAPEWPNVIALASASGWRLDAADLLRSVPSDARRLRRTQDDADCVRAQASSPSRPGEAA